MKLPQSRHGQKCLNDELKGLQARQPAASRTSNSGVRKQSRAESRRGAPSSVQNGFHRNCLTENGAARD